MNGLFGPYIEKWMHFVTIKNMLLLAIGSVIITDLGLHLMLLFLKSLLKLLFGRLLVL